MCVSVAAVRSGTAQDYTHPRCGALCAVKRLDPCPHVHRTRPSCLLCAQPCTSSTHTVISHTAHPTMHADTSSSSSSTSCTHTPACCLTSSQVAQQAMHPDESVQQLAALLLRHTLLPQYHPAAVCMVLQHPKLHAIHAVLQPAYTANAHATRHRGHRHLPISASC